MADIKAHADIAGDDVRRAGKRLDAAHGGDQSGSGLRVALDGGDPLGCAGERILAQIHRAGAGMVGFAVKGKFVAALASDGFDDAEAEIQIFEHRALLDVELDEGEGTRVENRIGELRGVGAEGFDCLGQRGSAFVSLAEEGLVDVADERAASNEWHEETNALFF